MTKTIVSVSKKHNSVWRIYFLDYNEDGEPIFQTKRINPLSVWYYKLKKSKLCNDICASCGENFSFYKTRFEKMVDYCYNCDPETYNNS